jgi:hypothetical protein
MAGLQSLAANTMSQDAVKIRALAVDDPTRSYWKVAALNADETDIALVGEETCEDT